MAAARKRLATIWELPDPLWRELEPLLVEESRTAASQARRPSVPRQELAQVSLLPAAVELRQRIEAGDGVVAELRLAGRAWKQNRPNRHEPMVIAGNHGCR
jgi:hypothetical protein